MGYLADEIENAASELGITLSKLHIGEVLEIRKKLAENFSIEPEFPWRLSYQNLKNTQSIHHSKGWSFIQDYVGEEEIILFVNPNEEKDMWIIPSGSALTSILGETIGFPLYVTSRDTDYMLCFDDHDCLIANGKAVEWIRKLSPDHPSQ
ncbi:MAG: hypothetical protein HC836_35460 [Richelia sp. RM2_1_2]|nr:hypothetical protein [Richelia sp. SM2_1_7]NJM21687.1 hypothetical protein [Richelia sp. SM1_7_0]NJO31069.1 hypothetical protein [Richelia sp. SL_2_1]NJO63323.1 hypothetical protein [Richelia sp. RM2_1_2]